jgi:hypothetical protein
MHVAIFYLKLSAHHPFLITRQQVQQVVVRPDPLDLRAQQAPLEQLARLVSAALQVSAVLQVLQESKAQSVQPALQDLQVSKALQVQQGLLPFLVPLVKSFLMRLASQGPVHALYLMAPMFYSHPLVL